MGKLILVRHGQTNWDKENRLQGSLDIPLNDEGRKEAEEIASKLSKFKINAVYSSPTSCSLSTANEIASLNNLKVKKVKELIEFNHGVWQGLLLSDIKKRYKRQYNSWKVSPTSGCPPKGESVKDAYDRAVSIMHKIIDKNKGQTVCVVSGNIFLSVLKCYLKHMDLDKMWKFVPGKTWWDVFEI